MNYEEKLLEAIFEDCKEEADNYPDTNAEKAGYAFYVLTKALEPIGNAISRSNRCENFCKLNAPEIILHNEAKMALKHLTMAKSAVDDAYNEISMVFDRTKDSKSQPSGKDKEDI